MIPVKSKGKIRSIAEWLFLVLLFGGLWFAADYWTKHPELKEKYFPSEVVSSPPVLEPEVSLPTPAQQSPTTLQLATEALERNQPKKALRFLNKWIREHPNDKIAYLYLGRIALMQENYADAKGYFETVLKLEPYSKEALESIAIVNFSQVPELIKRSQWREAADLLQLSKAHIPDQDAWQNLWAQVGPRMEWIETSNMILQILKDYRLGNELFLKGWAFSLPNFVAAGFFDEAQTKFQIALSQLDSHQTKLSQSLYTSLTKALKNRIESTETVLNFARGVTAQIPQDWDEVNQQLKDANTLIRRTVVTFEKMIASQKGILTDEEERNLKQHIESTLKGILVIFSK